MKNVLSVSGITYKVYFLYSTNSYVHLNPNFRESWLLQQQQQPHLLRDLCPKDGGWKLSSILIANTIQMALVEISYGRHAFCQIKIDHFAYIRQSFWNPEV